ncbi:MAG: AMP-binding protein [Clostridia bacterium]|nr:AMP-binding protein [Clostridia bacterium]
MKNYPLNPVTEYRDVREMVETLGVLYGDAPAYSFRIRPTDEESVKVSFRAMADEVKALGNRLISLGYAGKHCAMIGKLSYAWVRLYLSLLSIGAVVVPLDRDWSADELASTVSFAECEYLFHDADLVEKVKVIMAAEDTRVLTHHTIDGEGVGTTAQLLDEGLSLVGELAPLRPEIDADACSLIVFTSGTTGKGKGVMLSQKALMSDITGGLEYISVGKKTVAVLPPHHTFGSTVNLFGNMIAGAEIYISAGLRYIQKELKWEQPEHLILVPLYLETFYRKIMANVKETGKETILGHMMKVSNGLRHVKLDLRSKLFSSILTVFGGKLKLVICGGAPLNLEIIEAYESWGITVLNGYGITECAPLLSVNRNKDNVKGSVGRVLRCVDIKIADPNEDDEGEIRVKGPNVMMGYYKQPEATAEVFDEEGYFCTGDYGKMVDGSLYITGRLKNLIILSNGKNVYPEEIETELCATGGILEIVVYEGQSKRGVAHNTIVAEIYPDNEYMKANGVEDVTAYLKAKIDDYNRTATPYKKIGLLKVRKEEFPKNTLRKIKRFELDRTIK